MFNIDKEMEINAAFYELFETTFGEDFFEILASMRPSKRAYRAPALDRCRLYRDYPRHADAAAAVSVLLRAAHADPDSEQAAVCLHPRRG